MSTDAQSQGDIAGDHDGKAKDWKEDLGKSKKKHLAESMNQL